MRVRRIVVSAVSWVLAIGSVLVAVTTIAAHADPETGTALPPGPVGTAWYVKAAGDVVYATWGTTQDSATLYRTAADGSGTWDRVIDPSTSAGIPDPWLIGDGIVVPQPVTNPGDACPTYRIVTTAAAWTAPQPTGACVAPIVGTGSDLVALGTPGSGVGQGDYRVYDAAQGPTGGVLKEVKGQRPALDGHWVLTATPFAVWATDMTGQHAQVSTPIPAGCDWGQVTRAVGEPATSSGYALLSCTDGSGHTTATYVVPLDGRVPFTLPAEGAGWSLGNGFASQIRGADNVVSAHVVDFSEPATEHAYGVATVRASPSDSGTPREVWRESGRVYTATLPWLGSPPTQADDSTPPGVEFQGDDVPAVRLTDALKKGVGFGWFGADAAFYDVQTRSSDEGPKWHPAFYSRTVFPFLNSMTFFENRPVTICLRVRAGDRAGNLSAWGSRCTRVDGSRPTMSFQSSPVHSVITHLAPAHVRFQLQGSDDGPIASYQVERRSFGARHGAGQWLTGRHWNAVTASHVDAAISAHREVCFRARATDQVGRVSEWGKPWCKTTPYDDSDLAANGAHRVHDDELLGGGATALGAHGSLALSGVSGREVWVRARGPMTQCPIVSWGGKPFFGNAHPCELGASHDGLRWYSWRVHRLRHGTIHITSPTYDPLTVDAVAVVR